jgi:hypothetical protein
MPSLALLYLDVRARRLYLLNEAARQLRAVGVPLLGEEASLARLRTPAGERVSAAELPLPAAARLAVAHHHEHEVGLPLFVAT